MLDVLSTLISAFWIGLETTSIMVLFHAFLKCKKKNGQIVLGFLSITLLTTLICNTLPDVPVRAFLCMLPYLFIMPQLYEGKILSQVLLIVLGFTIITLLDVFFINGFCALIGVPYSELIWFKRTYVMLVTVGKLLSILVTWIIRYVRTTRILGQMNNKWLMLILIFPVTSLVMLYMLFTTTNQKKDVSVGILIACVFLTVASIAMIYIISALEKATNQEQDLRLLKQQMQLQTDNMKAMELNYRTQRRVTHEFERHLHTIQNLISDGEYETVKAYVGKLQKDRALRIVSVHSNHPVIDAILNQKHQLAQEGNIKMQIDVNDLSGVRIPSDKLVVLLANLLDNAIEACLRQEGCREIHCKIIQEDGLYIAIRNTSRPVKVNDGMIISSKENAANHGYGLQAVRYVLAELDAEYTFDYSEGWFRFVAEIS